MVTRRPVYRAINAPARIAGIDRRMFGLAGLAGVLGLNVLSSPLAGVVLFVALYALGWATRGDPHFLTIWLRTPRARRYDPIAHQVFSVEVQR